MAVRPLTPECYRPGMKPALVLAAALTLTLAACGSGTSTPSTAAQIARKLPGCQHPFPPSGGVSVQASTEQECTTPDAEVFVATFTSAGLERQWITAQQAGTCEIIQGGDWAVELLPTVQDSCGVAAKAVKALGGRVVNG